MPANCRLDFPDRFQEVTFQSGSATRARGIVAGSPVC
jgi:hypothetical protein